MFFPGISEFLVEPRRPRLHPKGMTNDQGSAPDGPVAGGRLRRRRCRGVLVPAAERPPAYSGLRLGRLPGDDAPGPDRFRRGVVAGHREILGRACTGRHGRGGDPGETVARKRDGPRHWTLRGIPRPCGRRNALQLRPNSGPPAVLAPSRRQESGDPGVDAPAVFQVARGLPGVRGRVRTPERPGPARPSPASHASPDCRTNRIRKGRKLRRAHAPDVQGFHHRF